MAKKLRKIEKKEPIPWLHYAKTVGLIITAPIWLPLAGLAKLCEMELLGAFALFIVLVAAIWFGIWSSTGDYTVYSPGQTVYIRYGNQPAIVVNKHEAGRLGPHGDVRVILTVNGKPEVREIAPEIVSDKPWDEVITPASMPTTRSDK